MLMLPSPGNSCSKVNGQLSPRLIGLPGSHSKWVQVQDGCLVHFDTFMTGELYAAACEHTILGRTQQRGGPFDQPAFERGVHVALSADGLLGPLSQFTKNWARLRSLFSVPVRFTGCGGPLSSLFSARGRVVPRSAP